MVVLWRGAVSYERGTPAAWSDFVFKRHKILSRSRDCCREAQIPFWDQNPYSIEDPGIISRILVSGGGHKELCQTLFNVLSVNVCAESRSNDNSGLRCIRPKHRFDPPPCRSPTPLPHPLFVRWGRLPLSLCLPLYLSSLSPLSPPRTQCQRVWRVPFEWQQRAAKDLTPLNPRALVTRFALQKAWKLIASG